MSVEEEDFAAVTSDFVTAKILHVLSIYPCISPSMLQVGLGTALPPKIWHPCLETLIQANKVRREVVSSTTPKGRDNTYHRIILVGENDNVGQS